MTIRHKMLLLFAASIVALALVSYGIARTILLEGFRELEKKQTIADVNRAVNIIHQDIAELARFAEDWAAWDDTYRFVTEQNQEYIDRNLIASMFVTQKINIFMVIDNEGRVVIKKAFDFDANRDMPWPDQLDNYAASGSKSLPFDTLTKTSNGIIVLPEGPILVAAHPITPSVGDGPINGTLLVGRYLNQERLKDLSNVIQLSITVTVMDNVGLPAEYETVWSRLQYERVVVENHEDIINGYIALNDIYGVPAFILKIEGERGIFSAGNAMLHYFIVVLLLSGLALAALTFWLMEKSVISRVTSLHRGVAEIAATSNVTQRISIQGNDEIVGLAAAINSMLAALEKNQAELQYCSLYDGLTGVYNRSFFEEQLRVLSADAGQPVSMIVCDIDGLKLVNDSLGHQQGDALLIAAADVLKASCPGNATICRTGGDEFVIIVKGQQEEAELISKSIQQAVAEYNRSQSGSLALSISLGVAGSFTAGQDIADIFKQADSAMYRQKLHRSKSARSAVVNTLKQTLALRDYITEGHAERMTELITQFGEACGLPAARKNDLQLFAEFHDIGKVGIPDNILFKPAPLTPDEWEIMKQHAEIGYRIAQAAPDFAPIADWILKHHEWWNGQGYPLGIKGEDIPIECRLLAIVDAYDAMTHDRPYRRALPESQALAEIKRLSGTQFDPRLVSIFVKLVESIK